jgi:hypothetical protein
VKKSQKSRCGMTAASILKTKVFIFKTSLDTKAQVIVTSSLQIAFGRFACVVVLLLGFVAAYLAVKLVNQFINGSIQIGMGASGKEIVALDVNVALGNLSSLFLFLFFDTEQDFDIHHLVKMTRYSVDFAGYIGT